MSGTPLRFDIAVEHWPYRQPVRINGRVLDGSDVVVVTLSDGQHRGRGEALGVQYLGDTAEKIAMQLEVARPAIEAGPDMIELRQILPRGGARNAVDSALWDFEAQRCGEPVWRQIGLSSTRPLVTTFTIGIDTPDAMAAAARACEGAREIKIKLDGANADRDRLLAVRAARPDAVLMVDANQGWTMHHLETLLPELENCGVALIEQPLPVGGDAGLEGFRSPIPIAADESIQDSAELEFVAQRYQAINIKLDKTGGLTEALVLAEQARKLGLSLMVGCMGGTSLSMAPHFILGQICDRVDLDGPYFLKHDREPSVRYVDGVIVSPELLWGYPRSR